MTNDRIRWGIVSTARIAHQFVGDMAFVPDSEVVAVASRTQAAADKFAAQYGIPGAYEGYRRLLDDPQVDAVYVATPHTLHYQNTVDAIRAGKHVLCEKPFTVTPDECRRLFEIAAESSVFVMEAMWTWFLPAIRKALEWVAEGRIGPLRQVKADFGYPLLPYDPGRREYNFDLAGGCLLEMGIYPVALARLFTQRDPASVQVAAHIAPNGVEDEVSVLYDYGQESSGLRGVLGTSYRSKLPNGAFLIGEEGHVSIPDFWRASQCALYRIDECVDQFEDGRRGRGFEFEIMAANADIRCGRQQNRIMSWAETQKLQDHMAQIKALF